MEKKSEIRQQKTFDFIWIEDLESPWKKLAAYVGWFTHS